MYNTFAAIDLKKEKNILQKKTLRLDFSSAMLYNVVMENYVKNGLADSFSVRSIYTIHYFKYGMHFRFPREEHDFWELVYVDGGRVTVSADKNDFVLKQGEAVLHAPGVSHTVSTDNGFASAAIISFECPSRAMRGLANRTFTFGEREKRILQDILAEGSLTYAEKLNELRLYKMTRRAQIPFGAEQIIRNNIELLLIYLSRAGEVKEEREEPNSAKNADVVARIIEILQDNVYSTISLDELAGELYFSKTYLKSAFKRATGKSIIQFYLNLKTEEAKKLISRNYTFTEIADKLCISSVHYFSRMFKQRTGMNPSEYAGSIKADNLIK